MSMSYVYPNPALEGEPCPICGKKSWDIFKCDKCGKVFCKYCRPDLVEEDDDMMEVNCDCGNGGIFIDM